MKMAVIDLVSFPCFRDIILDNKMDFTDIIKFFNGKLPKSTFLNRKTNDATYPGH